MAAASGGIFLFPDVFYVGKYGVFDVTSIPLYWYTEPNLGSEVLKHLPVITLDPAPPERVVLADADGVIHCEAILMGALPWPRFRRFLDGKEVVLPFRIAIALERLELSHASVNGEGECHCGFCQGCNRSTHYRVEVTDQSGHSVKLTRWCDCHFEFSFKNRGSSPACHPRLPPRRGVEGPRQPKGVGAPWQVYGEAKPPIKLGAED